MSLSAPQLFVIWSPLTDHCQNPALTATVYAIGQTARLTESDTP